MPHKKYAAKYAVIALQLFAKPGSHENRSLSQPILLNKVSLTPGHNIILYINICLKKKRAASSRCQCHFGSFKSNDQVTAGRTEWQLLHRFQTVIWRDKSLWVWRNKAIPGKFEVEHDTWSTQQCDSRWWWTKTSKAAWHMSCSQSLCATAILSVNISRATC